MGTLKVGDPAPDFTLPDQTGKTHSLSDYRGKWVLTYFYPRDNTPGCTVEACTLRDEFSEFKKRGAVVLGVSADSVKSHEGFAKKFKLPFPLLSDPEKRMIEKYGAWGKKSFMGRSYMGIFRNSLLINPQGRIAKIYEKVKPELHAGEVLSDIGS